MITIKLEVKEYSLLEKNIDKKFRKLNSIIKIKLKNNDDLNKNDVAFLLKKLDKKFLNTKNEVLVKLNMFILE